MKKRSIIILLLISSIATQAQYKKASFLNKSGRTHDLGITSHFVGKSNSTALGIFYSYGREKGKRVFHWFDLEFTLPAQYSYKSTVVSTGDPVAIKGKTSVGLFYRYNLAVYLTDFKNEDKKVLPFADAGINVMILSMVPRTAKYSPDGNYSSYEITNYPEIADVTSYGAHVGGGIIYKFKEKIALKAVLNYNFQGNVSGGSGTAKEDNTFYYLTNHPSLSVGLRFKIEKD